MRKISGGFVACLGVLSALITFNNAFPDFRDLFIGLIGVSVGFFLGIFTPNATAKKSEKSSKLRWSSYAVVLFLSPLAVLFGIVLVAHLSGLLTADFISAVFSYSFILLGISYFAAVFILRLIFEALSSSDKEKDKSLAVLSDNPSDDISDNNPDE